jgi:hypothetical protein
VSFGPDFLSTARDARATAPWTSDVRAEARQTPRSAQDLWKSDAHGNEMQHELTFVLFDPKCVLHVIAQIQSKSNICIPQKIFFCIISMKHAAFFGQRSFSVAQDAARAWMMYWWGRGWRILSFAGKSVVLM